MADGCKEQSELTVGKIAEQLVAEVFGNGDLLVTGINSLEEACESEMSFVTSDKHAGKCKESKAGSVIVKQKIEGLSKTQLVVENVDAALIKALSIFAPKLTPISGIHPTAVIDEGVVIGEGVAIGAGAYIARNVKIGASSVIAANCSVGENTVIGENTRLDSSVVVYHNCTIGNNCIILANTTIGSTGFGYSFIDGAHQLIPHNGGVIIEDYVEIGANTSVDRAKFGNTIIGARTKIDNLVQISHNCVIGKSCLLAGQVAIAGSSKLGNGVVVAGRAGVSDHINVGDGSIICALTVLFKDIGPGQVVSGDPPCEMNEALRIKASMKRLPKMGKDLKTLAEKVKKLEAAEDNK